MPETPAQRTRGASEMGRTSGKKKKRERGRETEREKSRAFVRAAADPVARALLSRAFGAWPLCFLEAMHCKVGTSFPLDSCVAWSTECFLCVLITLPLLATGSSWGICMPKRGWQRHARSSKKPAQVAGKNSASQKCGRMLEERHIGILPGPGLCFDRL